MARAPDGLTVRRAALLLRCQQARENRQRGKVDTAERTHQNACGACVAAADALRTQAAGAEAARVAAHESLRGCVVHAHSLAALTDFEDELAAETAACAERQRTAAMQVQDAEVTLEAAREALAAEARVTAKRARFAEALQKRYRRARDAAEDATRDEDRADAWRPA